MTLPDFDALWNYDPKHVASTEVAFRALLPLAEQRPDRAYHLELLTQIARAQGLQGQFVAANATLDEVQRQLRDDLVQPRIRYFLERGRMLNSSGHPAEACSWFQEAWELAQAHANTAYAIDAAHMLGIAAPAESRLSWNLTALRLAETATDARSQQWAGSLYNNIGWTYHDQGQYDEALAIFQQALEWQKAHGKVGPTRIAQWCVGRALRSLRRYEEALAVQLALLAAWQRDDADEDGYVSEEVGECLLAVDRQSESRAHFSRAYTLLSQDSWLVAHEPERLQRLQRLGEANPATGT